MRCATRASNGPDHLGLRCAICRTRRRSSRSSRPRASSRRPTRTVAAAAAAAAVRFRLGRVAALRSVAVSNSSVLTPPGSDAGGTPFLISYAPREYGKKLVGRLVILTDEMQVRAVSPVPHKTVSPRDGTSCRGSRRADGCVSAVSRSGRTRCGGCTRTTTRRWPGCPRSTRGSPSRCTPQHGLSSNTTARITSDSG